MNKEGLLIIRIFFSFCALLGLFNVLKPELIVKFTARWFQLYLKLFGFDSTIYPTKRAMVISRIWALFMTIVFVIVLFNIK